MKTEHAEHVSASAPEAVLDGVPAPSAAVRQFEKSADMTSANDGQAARPGAMGRPAARVAVGELDLGQVDQAGAGAGVVWLSVTALAEREGCSKSTVSEKLKQLAALGRPVPTKPEGRRLLVDAAAYLVAKRDTSDPAKVVGAETAREGRAAAGMPAAEGGAGQAAPQSAYIDAKTEREQIAAAVARMDYAERRGNLVAIAGPRGVEAAMVEAGRLIVQALQLGTHAGEIAAAALAGGELAVRKLLKTIERDQLAAIADALRLMERDGKAQEAAGPYEVDLPLVEMTVPA